MRCKKGDVSQDFNEMVAGLEIRTGTVRTQRRICQDESHFPTRNSMIRKLNDVSHKVKADASFFNQEKNRQLEILRKKKAKTSYKYEAKKMRQVIEFRKRINSLFDLNVWNILL